jgi:hypothetical protein
MVYVRHAANAAKGFGRSHERGSIMLVVVVALLMISMMGMAYLQTSRLDQASAQTSAKSYIDVVANASIAYIGEVLKNDMITSDGVVFDRSQGIEGYDFPWTSRNYSYSVQFNDGSTDTSDGGQLDDTWLASSEPDFTSGHKGTWQHISNLNGIFLRLPSSSSEDATPDEVAVNNSNMDIKTRWGFDTDVPINVSNQSNNLDYAANGYEVLGADADGDGIYDSKWTWAPIRQVSGISYVMAARIIDNSAMLNMNVALSQVNGKDSYSDNIPQALNPAEWDFGNFVYSNGGTTSELRNLLAHRLGVTPTSSLALPVTSANMYTFWFNGALSYDNYPAPYNKLGILNELELRYRNGLNNPEITATIEGTSYGMETFLRGAETAETTYTKVSGVSKMDDYFQDEVRHQLTTVSGASVYRPSLPNETPGVYTKSNLYNMLTPNSPADSYDLYQKLKTFYSNTAMSEYSDSDVTSLSRQMTVNFVDYADADNLVSQSFEYDTDGNAIGYSGEVAGTTAVMGMESLPFITEVYTQRPYQFRYVTDKFYIWEYGRTFYATANESCIPGFAIEIRNPYQNPIMLKNVCLWIGKKGTTGVEVDLEDIAGSAFSNQQLGVNQALILYRNSSGLGSNSNHTISNLAQSSNSIKWVELPDTFKDVLFVNSESDKSSDFMVQLRATRQDGTKYNWGYCQVPLTQYVKNPANTIYYRENDWYPYLNVTYGMDAYYDLSDRDGEIQFSQTSTFSTGQGLNALAFTASQWHSNIRLIDDINENTDADLIYFGTTIDRLGQADKSDEQDQSVAVDYSGSYGSLTGSARGGVPGGPGSRRTVTVSYDGFSTANLFDTDTQQWSFPTSGILDHVGDLSLVPIIGLQEDTEFAQSLANAIKDDYLRRDYMIDMSSTNSYYVTDSTDSAYYNMSFGWALMQQFVNISPESDGLENDGDNLIDSQDNDELFLPGTINLNTVSENLLKQILPVKDTDERDDLASQIISLRGKSTDNSSYPGIPSLGDLFKMNSTQWGVSASSSKADQTLRQRQLGSIASTRSDVFTAYVLIRGYPSGDFRKGAVESKQFLVVYDRSRITNGQDKINILGYYEYD